MSRFPLIGLLSAALLSPVAAPADETLAEVLAAQPETTQARYPARNPQGTLSFFGVEPGMTVVEALPGGGWYSRILIDYLGPQGTLIGADYAPDMFPLFGFFNDEQLEAKKTWVESWSGDARGWVQGGADVAAFQFGQLPESMHGSADLVVMIRALHNLARFEPQGGYLGAALADVHAVLKPGGKVGIVQHEAPASSSDEFASGARGYLKRSFVISQMEAAGFEYLDSSDVNANPKDQPGPDDNVWRLPPTMSGSRDDPEKRAAAEAIGESNRMTLLFRKPA
jgi:predicted methyltransferase